MIVTRARKKSLLALGVATLLSVVLGSLPNADAQQQPASEQFVCNSRFSMQVTADGRLNFGALPNPAPDCRAGGSSYPLTTTWPFSPTSYTTVKIDGEFHRFERGTQVTPPTVVPGQSGGGSIFTRANFGDVEVSQLVQIVPNPATGGLEDAARISYSVDNVSPNTHNVGIRLFIDTRVGNSENPTFFVDGGAVTTETDYGANGPDLFTVQNPTASSQAGAGTTGDQFGNVRPGRFIIGDFVGLSASPWDYQASGQRIDDSAFAAYWETLQLGPENSTTYSMTYGLGIGGQGGGGGGGGGGGEPIPGCEETEQNQCGTTGDDDMSSSDGHVVGGPGNDNITLTVDSGTGSLSVDGGPGGDQIILNIEDPSSGAPISINSGDGADQISVPKQPGDLAPVIKTGGGNDVIKILTSTVSRRVAALQTSFVGRYFVNGGGGLDRFTLGLSNDVIDGAGGNDKINGAAGDDSVEGGAGDDDMSGGTGGDVLHGGDGANDFAGGAGNDTCLSDTRRDQFSGCERIRRNHRRNHQPI